MPLPDDATGYSPVGSTRDEDLLRMLRELPDLIVVIDASGNLIWGNRTAERLCTTTVDDAAGLSALNYVHPEDLPFVLLSLTASRRRRLARRSRCASRHRPVGGSWSWWGPRSPGWAGGRCC